MTVEPSHRQGEADAVADFAVLAVLAQHIAGFPVEELAIPVIASTAPLIAYLGCEASRHLTRLSRTVTGSDHSRTRHRYASPRIRREVARNPTPPAS